MLLLAMESHPIPTSNQPFLSLPPAHTTDPVSLPDPALPLFSFLPPEVQGLLKSLAAPPCLQAGPGPSTFGLRESTSEGNYGAKES